MRFMILALLLAGASSAAADDLAARFAARPVATSVALSPDGDKVAYVGAYKTGGYAVSVVDLKTGETRAILAGANLEVTPRSCRFKTETRLICTLYGLFNTVDYVKASNFTRILAIDTDGGNRKLLGEKRGGERFAGGVMDYLPDDPDHVLMEAASGYSSSTGTLVAAKSPGLGAALVDVRTGARTFVEKPSPATLMLAGDDRGTVRLRGSGTADADGIVKDTMTYAVRPAGSRDWRPLMNIALTDERAIAFDGFDADGSHLYELAPLDGRTALFALATDGSTTRTLVYAHPTVDVDGVRRIGKYRRPVGASFTVDRDEVHYFDPTLAKLATQLAKALPGNPYIDIRDESWDGTKILIYAARGGQPGQYYLYDTTARKLGGLFGAYPGLDGVALGEVRAVSYAAADGTRIPGYLTLPPGHTDARGLPALLMPHGGPTARDTLGFDFLAQFFAAEGFAVLQPNFRGSSGFGESFSAGNAFHSWRLAIGDVNDGARWLVTQGVSPNKLAIFGWSYGGYAALQANVLDPTLYRAAVAVAPVTDLEMLRSEYLHFTNFKLVDAQIGSPENARAGSPARNAARITAPVMIFHGDHDLNVDIAQSQAMVGALKAAGRQVEFFRYKDLDHQLDDSTVREDMLARSAAFLRNAMN